MTLALHRRLDRLDHIFGALSDRTRRRILARLARGEATVTELAAPLEISLPAVSRHLKVLESAGLIDRTVSGRVHHCSLKEAALADAKSWIREFWDSSLTKLAQYVE